MHADVKGALEQINHSWSSFTHRGKPMTKQEVKTVLEYAAAKGYKTTADLTDEEVDRLIQNNHDRLPHKRLPFAY